MPTKKQRIIELLNKGMTIKEIAKALETSEGYVWKVKKKWQEQQAVEEPKQEEKPEQRSEESEERNDKPKGEQPKTPEIQKVKLPEIQQQPTQVKKIVVGDISELDEEQETEEEDDITQARAESLAQVLLGIVVIAVDYLTPDKPLTKKEEKFLYGVYLRYFLNKPEIAEQIPPEADILLATATVILPRWIEYVERKKKEKQAVGR